MNQNEKVIFGVLIVALIAVVAFTVTSGPAVASVDGVVSQSPTDANTSGPSYMVANMPYGYGPPVTMGISAPVVTQGFQGQPTPGISNAATKDCGC